MRQKQPKPSMSMLWRIAKRFGISYKANDKQAFASPPDAHSTDCRSRGRLAKQVSLETTSSYATSAPSTISASTYQGVSLCDSWTGQPLEAISSTDSLLEDLAIKEKAAATQNVVLDTSLTVECSAISPQARNDAVPSANHPQEAEILGSVTPFDGIPPVDGIAKSTVPSSQGVAPSACQATREPCNGYKTLSWAEIFSSDSSSSSLCEVPWATCAINEGRVAEEADVEPVVNLPPGNSSPGRNESSDPTTREDAPDAPVPTASESTESLPKSTFTYALTRIDEEDEDEDSVDEEQEQSFEKKQQRASANHFIAHILDNAPLEVRYRQHRRELLIECPSVSVILEDEEEDIVSIPSHNESALNVSITSVTDTSVMEDISSPDEGQNQAKPTLEWPALTWAEVFSSDSTSSSLCDIGHGDTEAHPVRGNQEAIEEALCSTSDSIESMYQPCISPVYWYPSELYSFSEAAHMLLHANGDSPTSPHSQMCHPELPRTIAEGEPTVSFPNTQESPLDPTPLAATEPVDTQWPQLSWADVFSSDSETSLLSDLAEQTVHGCDADTLVTPHQSTAASFGSEEDEDEDDPFSVKQDLSFQQISLEQKQEPISTNPFIVNIFERATDHGYRNRGDKDSRRELWAEFQTVPTIVEEEEPLEGHATSSASLNCLLTSNSDPFEYTQVCLELRGVCEIILITLQYSVDEDSVAGSANASAIVPLSHVSAASRMRPTETNFFSTASQTWRPNRGIIFSFSPRRRGRHAEDHLK